LNRSNRGALMNGGQPEVQNRFRSEGACVGDNFCFTTKDATMKTLALIALTLAVTATSASAYDDSWRQDRIDSREARQAARIREGRASGELTRSEAHRLWAEQQRIHQMERWAKRDGFISREEARRIEQAQDQASRDIRHEKHDGQKTWWAR
jgi:hypothetical protein